MDWAGPLFYPPVGKIAVLNSGARIEVWDDESESAECFTGLLLAKDRTRTQVVIFDLSCCWVREFIDHIEEPTEADLALGMLPRPSPHPSSETRSPA